MIQLIKIKINVFINKFISQRDISPVLFRHLIAVIQLRRLELLSEGIIKIFHPIYMLKS